MGRPAVDQEVLLVASEEGSSSPAEILLVAAREPRCTVQMQQRRRKRHIAGALACAALAACALVSWRGGPAASGEERSSARSAERVVGLATQIGDSTQLVVTRAALVFESITQWTPMMELPRGSKVVASGPPQIHRDKQLLPIRAIVGRDGAYKEQAGAVQMQVLSLPALDSMLPEAPLPPGLNGVAFDCNAGFKNWRWGWSASKRTYCCHHAGRGCFGVTTASSSFDCSAGVDNLDKGWSVAKKDFCCRTNGKGCTQMTSTSPDPFDCEAGLENFEIGWSVWKKHWCCANRRQGCPDSRHVTGVCHIHYLNYHKLVDHAHLKSDFDEAIENALAFLARGSKNAAQKVGVGLEDWEGIDGETVVRFKISPSEKILMHDVHGRVVAAALPEVLLPAVRSVPKLEAIATPARVRVSECSIDIMQLTRCSCTNGQPHTGSGCPAEGGTACKACDLGYSLSPGHACEPNGCTCHYGMEARGAACHTDGKEICAFCEAGNHLNKTDPSQTRCDPNVCKCEDGTAVTDAECDNHLANICKACKEGYHVDPITKQCNANVCSCFNGFSVRDGSSQCRVHGAQMCQRCVDFFHKEDGMCKPNKCSCPNGVAAVGQGPPGCQEDGEHICVNCNDGLHLRTNRACGEKECVCLNGTAATGDACLMHHGNICAACEKSFTLESSQCIKDQCQCAHGIPVLGEECNLDQAQHCKSCNHGYHLEGDVCQPNECTCDNGVGAVGETCLHEGTEVCASCTAGYHHEAATASHSEALLVHCVVDQCVCDHGDAATVDSAPGCKGDQEHTCKACETGYSMTDHNTCKAKECTCTNGNGGQLGDCTWDGKEDCVECNKGFHLTTDGVELPGTRRCRADGETSPAPFDCSAGFDNRLLGWSELKKTWCCQVQHIGCSNQDHSGEDVCEGKGLNEEQCDLIGCCVWDSSEDGQGCRSSVGPGEPCKENALITLKASVPDTTEELDQDASAGAASRAMCLDALHAGADGGDVGLGKCNSHSPRQQWRYDKGLLVNQLGLCIEVVGAAGNNAALQMSSCRRDALQQQWEFVQAELQFRSKASLGHCLAVHADKMASGEPATLLECLQLHTQQWLLPSGAIGSWPAVTTEPSTTATTTELVPLSCPEGTSQVGGLNADVANCGPEGCTVNYDTTSIQECRELCHAQGFCRAFTWAPVGGDRLHMKQTVCSLKRVEVSDQQWGPNQIMCQPDDLPPRCPSGTSQIGELSADVKQCGHEGADCDLYEDVATAEECRDRCTRRGPSCRSFSWDLGGDPMNLQSTVCGLYAVEEPDSTAGPKQIMCTPDPPVVDPEAEPEAEPETEPATTREPLATTQEPVATQEPATQPVGPALACPAGSTQVGGLNADVSSCGIDGCEVRYNLSSVEACHKRCELLPSCKAFTWAPVGGDKLHLNKTVCSLYAVDEADQEWGPHQIMCKSRTEPNTCERCPVGTCQRAIDGQCALFDDDGQQTYHCAVDNCEQVPEGTVQHITGCWLYNGNPFYSVVDPEMPCRDHPL